MRKLLFILLGLISSHHTLADITNGPLQQHPALCNYGYNPNCHQNQARSKKIIETTIVHKASKYGAIALNKKTGVVSGVLNMNSESEAKNAAIRQCKSSGENSSCESLGVVRNGCIAVASGRTGKKWSLYKAGEKPGLTEQVAMNKCKASGAKNCKIIMPEGCSIPEGMYN